MTQRILRPGRSGKLSSTASRSVIPVLCACLLGLAAPAAMAASPGLAGDSADQLPAAVSVTQTLTAPAVQLPERRMLSVKDVELLIAAKADEPVVVEGRVQSMLKRALTLLGTPYRWGGNSPDSGFDCSGLVGYVFRTALGIELPRVSRDMARDGESVDRSALSAGDLVFFSRRGRNVDHVGIYIGEGRFLHAPRTGKDVMVSELDTGYWSQKFMQARRVAGMGS
ncbi:C40 family peptidase [Luteimonas sp. RIT-PG2_3]